jgi:aryl-alcohol dehydrogenase-like predicted oxidoreductase
MAIRVFAAGVLATDERHGREVAVTAEGGDLTAEQKRAAAALAAVGPEHGTRAQRALRFVLAEPRVSCAVVGLAEVAHLEEALAGAAMGPLPDPALAALREVWNGDFDRGA